MHRVRLTIDLPSEALPSDPVLLGVLRWIFTTGQTGARERLTGNGLGWCRRLMQACARGGLSDVVAVVADGTELYLDERGTSEDIGEALRTVLERGGLQGGFQELHVVVAGSSDGWHAVAAIRLRTEVAKGVPEIDIDWSARSLELRITDEETPLEFERRIVGLGSDAELVDAAMRPSVAMLDRLVAELADSLGTPSEPGGHHRVHASGQGRTVVVPGPRQVARFRSLGFGRSLRGRTYRPRATEKRSGAYDEPQVYYFFDPYHDLLSWIVAREVAEQRWCGPQIDLVDTDGLPAGAPSDWKVSPDAVVIGREGIAVDDSVPPVSGFDVAEAGSPNAPGYGGEL